jgi:uncharacterized peroxidase-related enzyme
MRLASVERGHRVKESLVLGLVRLRVGDTPDVMRAQMHRPEFFGRAYGAITHRAMRGPGDWSIAERELFAAYVSTRNRCDFCEAAHSEFACQAGDRGEVERTLREGVAGDPRLDAALAFLAAFAAGPEDLSLEHVDRLRDAGVRDEAIRDLAQIAFSFCLINRVADALGFKVLSPGQFARGWPMMRDRGYRI